MITSVMKQQHTWISDVREGLKQFNKDFFYYFNDATLRQRRIKFYTTKQHALKPDELYELQSFIEKRRPYLNVTVKDWTNSAYSSPFSHAGPTYCVYYKPKVTF